MSLLTGLMFHCILQHCQSINKLNEYCIHKVKDIKLGAILKDVWETERDRVVKRERGIELRLAFKEGLSLEIIRVSLTKSSEAEEQEDRINFFTYKVTYMSLSHIKTQHSYDFPLHFPHEFLMNYM